MAIAIVLLFFRRFEEGVGVVVVGAGEFSRFLFARRGRRRGMVDRSRICSLSSGECFAKVLNATEPLKKLM